MTYASYSAALYEKFSCPPLNLSFIESQRQRLCFRNARSLYSRQCDATKKHIISAYSPDKPFKIYCSDYWYSDNWDPLEYGQNFDFSKTFFEQFAKLQLKVPRIALLNVKGINSDYCNVTVGNKNCYLIFGGDFNEDCMYGTLCMENISSLDLDFSNNNNLCYELCDSLNCYGCQFTLNSKNCSNCYYISDCASCSECILCTNLFQKSYCIENQQYDKATYLEKKQELLNGTFQSSQKLLKKFLQLLTKRIVKFANIINCENCNGDYLKNSKNCLNCYDISDSEDLKNVLLSVKSKDCFESSFIGVGTELCFNVQSALGAYNSICGFFIIESSDIAYSKNIISSKNIFGCCSLRHKQYCIFNKQYSEAEFQDLRQRIIAHMKKTGEWGQFFPPKLSDFAYNETTAHNYFSLTKEEALKQGFLWKDDDSKTPQSSKIKIPDNITAADESLTKAVLQCETCHKNYKILLPELHFYKNNNIPIPHICEGCRHKRRTNMRNPRHLWPRNCQKCAIALESTYAPGRSEIVYCEKCYQQTVY